MGPRCVHKLPDEGSTRLCTNRQAEWAPYLHYKKYYCIVFAFVPVILTSKWDGHGQILGMHHHHACWINWWSMATFTDRYMKKQLTESEMQVSSNCLKEGEEWWALLYCWSVDWNNLSGKSFGNSIKSLKKFMIENMSLESSWPGYILAPLSWRWVCWACYFTYLGFGSVTCEMRVKISI